MNQLINYLHNYNKLNIPRDKINNLNPLFTNGLIFEFQLHVVARMLYISIYTTILWWLFICTNAIKERIQFTSYTTILNINGYGMVCYGITYRIILNGYTYFKHFINQWDIGKQLYIAEIAYLWKLLHRLLLNTQFT